MYGSVIAFNEPVIFPVEVAAYTLYTNFTALGGQHVQPLTRFSIVNEGLFDVNHRPSY